MQAYNSLFFTDVVVKIVAVVVAQYWYSPLLYSITVPPSPEFIRNR